MGGKQSRRSVDITTTPKKEGIPADGSVGDAAAPGDGKLERIEETDMKPTTNGIAPHTDVAEDKEKDKDEATEKEKQEEVKAEDTKQESAGESPAESAEATTPTDATTPASPNAATSSDSKEPKKKDKMKKKWSFRSISFSKKDKNKPARDEAPKNGDVTKEETLAEGGEETENGSGTAGSPVEEKSAVSSPSAETEVAPASAASAASAVASTESKEEASSPSAAATTATAASSPADEKQEEPTPSAPTPVPVEEKKEEVEKLEAEKKVVEVSPAGGQFVPDPVEVSVFRVQTVATPSSIIERKTSEDIPSLPPSSPPPTPIDPSPLQQAQQAAATASLLAEALKLPAEAAADEDSLSDPLTDPVADPVTDEPPPTPSESRDVDPQRPHVSSPPDESLTEQAPTPPKLEALPVVDTVVDADVNVVLVVATKPETAVEQSSAESPETKTEAPPLVEQQSPIKPKEDAPVAVTEAPPPLQEKLKDREESLVAAMEPASEGPQQEPKEVVEQSVESKVIGDVGSSTVSETSKQEDVPKEEAPKIVEEEIAIEEKKEVLAKEPPISTCDPVLQTEEGLMPLSEETLVEAKPAVVIPEEEEEEEETVNTVTDVHEENTQFVEAIPKVEETLELTMKVVEPEEEPPRKEAMQAESELAPTAFVVEEEEVVETVPDKVDVVPEEDSLPPPPVPGSPKACAPENLDIDATVVPCPVVDLEPQTTERSQDAEERPSSTKDQEENESPILPRQSRVSDSKNEEEEEEIVEDESRTDTSRLEPVSIRVDELPPAPQDTVPSTDSFEYPLPPEELSCPLATSSSYSIVSETKSEFPVPDANDMPSLRNPTETLLLTPPRSPSPQFTTVVDATVLTTSTIDSSQTHSDYQDQNHDQDRDQHHSDENDRSACTMVHEYEDSQLRKTVAKSPAETENQEESSISCQLSNNTTSSTTVQETHQSTPESEAPVENKLTQDSTTESSEEKVTPVAVPIETPAPPPSAPAITEDVASVAKAVEEIEISAKAIAAATIECTTTEIIADAPYENNVNE